MSSTPGDLPSLSPIQQHPPERRQRKKEYVLFYSCCCCCCCCLHTLGGVIGTVRGINYCSKLDPFSPDVRKGPSLRFLYDTSLLIVFVLLWVGLMLRQGPDALAVVLLSFILAGPLWLLAGSVVMAVRLAIRHDLPSKAQYWKALGRVTLYGVLGSVIGIGVMFPLFFLLLAAL